MFIIKHNGELLTTNKIINKTYNETLEFEIVLSQAYSNSNIMVYALKNNTNIYPEIIDNNYIFNNIDSNMKIIVDNVELNSYSVTIDGTYYGDFGYGSWILVSGDTIEIKNILTNQITLVKTLIVDNDFAGWLCNDKILVNCIVQDICDDNSNIEIFGNYSKRVSKIKLVFNNGINDTKELLFVEGEPFELPTPIRPGYIFVGWFEKLVEVNTVVDEELSVKFEKLTNIYTILYAGWTK